MAERLTPAQRAILTEMEENVMRFADEHCFDVSEMTFEGYAEFLSIMLGVPQESIVSVYTSAWRADGFMPALGCSVLLPRDLSEVYFSTVIA